MSQSPTGNNTLTVQCFFFFQETNLKSNKGVWKGFEQIHKTLKKQERMDFVHMTEESNFENLTTF